MEIFFHQFKDLRLIVTDILTQGAVIEVMVSIGPADTLMPDLVGWEEEHARMLLEAMGCTVTDTLWLQGGSDFGLEGGQVERTEPKAGQPLRYGDEVVLTVVSYGATTGEE